MGRAHSARTRTECGCLCHLNATLFDYCACRRAPGLPLWRNGDFGTSPLLLGSSRTSTCLPVSITWGVGRKEQEGSEINAASESLLRHRSDRSKLWRVHLTLRSTADVFRGSLQFGVLPLIAAWAAERRSRCFQSWRQACADCPDSSAYLNQTCGKLWRARHRGEELSTKPGQRRSGGEAAMLRQQLVRS